MPGAHQDPRLILGGVKQRLKGFGLWEVNSLNLFRITWKNEPTAFGGGFGEGRGRANYVELPPALTGVSPRPPLPQGGRGLG